MGHGRIGAEVSDEQDRNDRDALKGRPPLREGDQGIVVQFTDGEGSHRASNHPI